MTKRLIGSFILFELVLCCHCFFWGCPPCDLAQCPKLSCNHTRQILDSECGCCSVCAKADGESCGGLTNERCMPGSICKYRLGVIIGENRPGICEPGECKSMQCDYRHFCGYLPRESGPLLICHCPYYYCTGKDNPVCGYDGKKYNSICDLQSEECLKNKFIGLKHFGACPVTPEPPTSESQHLVTNSIPNNEDDLFGQIIEPLPNVERPTVRQGCIYKGQEYAPNIMEQIDSCTFIRCDENRNLAQIIVPGCPGGPIDPDYGVSEKPVHGGWTDWVEGECIGTCFVANKTLRRSCTNPAPRYEGQNCSGPSEEVFKCIPERCNYTCEYSEWSDWSPCSLTCGMGMQTRSRTLLVNLTEEEAKNCDVDETRSCSIVETCPTSCQKVIVGSKKMLDVNGCETVVAWPVYQCVGPCNRQGTCCQVARRRNRNVAVQCPGVSHYRDSRFDFIARCSCQGNCSDN